MSDKHGKETQMADIISHVPLRDAPKNKNNLKLKNKKKVVDKKF